MNNLYQLAAVQEVIARIDQLQPSSPRLWGKMDAAQMMAHCSSALEMASGKLRRQADVIGSNLRSPVSPSYDAGQAFRSQ